MNFNSNLKLEWSEWVKANMFQIHELQHNWTWQFFKSMLEFKYPSRGKLYENDFILNGLDDVELVTALGDKVAIYGRKLYINGKALNVQFVHGTDFEGLHPSF